MILYTNTGRKDSDLFLEDALCKNWPPVEFIFTNLGEGGGAYHQSDPQLLPTAATVFVSSVSRAASGPDSELGAPGKC